MSSIISLFLCMALLLPVTAFHGLLNANVNFAANPDFTPEINPAQKYESASPMPETAREILFRSLDVVNDELALVKKYGGIEMKLAYPEGDVLYAMFETDYGLCLAYGLDGEYSIYEFEKIALIRDGLVVNARVKAEQEWLLFQPDEFMNQYDESEKYAGSRKSGMATFLLSAYTNEGKNYMQEYCLNSDSVMQSYTAYQQDENGDFVKIYSAKLTYGVKPELPDWALEHLK